ncbi:MAG: endonuclease III [Candidatus Sumerlaeaceae bacterium]|nr:endonuclease III [Candidatus Sumerlaeaceae bacterium]
MAEKQKTSPPPAAKRSPTKKENNLQERGKRINELLAQAYPDARCSLNFSSPYELLVATILSAQCTDERVNQVTPAFFRRFPNTKALADAEVTEIEELIRSTGFYRNKARALKGMAKALVEHYGGEVPGTMEELVKLPGVGRKTANVVLGNCFNTPGITVDTHVSRVAQRLGLTKNSLQDKIEQDLMRCIPQADWTHFSHRTILHGRNVCQARKPRCEICILAPYCEFVSDQKRKKAK